MSFARASRFALPRSTARCLLQRRSLATHGAEEHVAESNIAFPKEDFSSPIWRNFVLFSLFVVGFYKFAPSPNEENLVTKWLEHNATPREVWARLNLQHLRLTAESCRDRLIIAEAKKAPIHRYRYPQSFEQHFPHRQPVGMSVNLDDLVVKRDKE